MEKGTMLSGYYPETIQEGYFIWAPANLLYAYKSPDILVGAEVLNNEMLVNVFGPSNQSEETWCSIYEKASLARQLGDWQEIIDLHALASQNDLKPNDAIEWFPFIQAYAYFDMQDEVNQLAPIINETPFYRYQAYQIFSNKEKSSEPAVESGNQYLAEVFCD